MEYPVKCSRCGKTHGPMKVSKFDYKWICCDGPGSCYLKELYHPEYAKAEQIESDAIMKNDWNFQGIGKPEDL